MTNDFVNNDGPTEGVPLDQLPTQIGEPAYAAWSQEPADVQPVVAYLPALQRNPLVAAALAVAVLALGVGLFATVTAEHDNTPAAAPTQHLMAPPPLPTPQWSPPPAPKAPAPAPQPAPQAPPPRQIPSSPQLDARYLATLRAAGITSPDGNAKTLHEGHVVCERLAGGEATPQLLQDIIDGSKGVEGYNPLTPAQAQVILDASIDSYCPVSQPAAPTLPPLPGPGQQIPDGGTASQFPSRRA